MAYGFSPSIFQTPAPPLENFLTPEELQQQEIAARFNASRGGGFVPAMVSALDYVRTNMPAQAPTPRTVSGGDVIGLMPEQTNALLNRVAEQNMLDQRMFEARQGEARADMRAREGRILSAREAQARRQQELAIEKQKMTMQEQKEAAERARPKLTPITGTNLAYEERVGPDGNPTMSVVPIGGATVPSKPAAPPRPVAVQTIDAGGNPVTKFVIPQEGMEYQAQPDEADKISTSDMKNVFEMLSKADMPEDAKVRAYQEFEQTGKLPYLEFRSEDTGYTTVTVTDEKGGQTLKRIKNSDIPEEGIRTKAPGVTKPPDVAKVVSIIKQAYDVKEVSDAPRKQSMELLTQLGLEPSWVNSFADSQGMTDDNSVFPFYLGEQFNLPASAPAKPASSASFDLKYNPATGTFE